MVWFVDVDVDDDEKDKKTKNETCVSWLKLGGT